MSSSTEDKFLLKMFISRLTLTHLNITISPFQEGNAQLNSLKKYLVAGILDDEVYDQITSSFLI